MDRPEHRNGLWVAFVKTPPLCATCGHHYASRAANCAIDCLRVTSWTCRDYERMPGADDDL